MSDKERDVNSRWRISGPRTIGTHHWRSTSRLANIENISQALREDTAETHITDETPPDQELILRLRFMNTVADAIKNGVTPEWVSGYRAASKKEKQKKIDYWLITDVGKIPVRVQMKPVKKTRSKGHTIPTLVIQGEYLDEEVLGQTISLVEKERERLIRRREQQT